MERIKLNPETYSKLLQCFVGCIEQEFVEMLK